MVKLLRSKRFCWSNYCGSSSRSGGGAGGEVKWELRPGGMVVQKRELDDGNAEEASIVVRVSMGSHFHYVSVKATSTFGELKVILSMVTKLEPRDQRLIFKGKEREDGDYLHMFGVGHMDKVLLLEDPVLKQRKLQL